MITVVTHCWAVNYPQYATFLRAQLSSIVLNPPKTDVRVVVCADKTDMRTVQVLDDLGPLLPSLEPMWLETQEMWCRTIGRNRAALQDKDSDLVWFADCDYLFGDSCFDALLDEWDLAGKPTLIYPAAYETNRDKAYIDTFLTDAIDSRETLTPVTGPSFTKRCGKAIGGLQITDGGFARRCGYINGIEKWHKIPETPFPTMREEAAFRKYLHGISGTEIKRISPLPSLFRLRHSIHGYGKNVENPVNF